MKTPGLRDVKPAGLGRKPMAPLMCLFVALLSGCLFAACGGERCDTPMGEGGTLDLLQPEFINLYNSPGSTLVINRGFRGIIVHCTNLEEYVAFDCVCPLDHDTRMLPDDNRAAVILTCPQCGSRFELYYGNPLDGAATACPLRQYNTRYYSPYLSIY